ncbi:MAG TPA: GNAT family N-acetyltransferase [Steroidobacteraceae bacterium]|jgi:predicted GNAT family acetyltransferase|nr:GNAT family N-acetyltransferase [Steroidobacteraceae bacterium]
MATSTIRHDPSARQFVAEVDGNRAHLDYTLADGVMTITHTRVPPAIGGRGIAGELMAAALDAARSAGWSVDPACSYAKAYMARHGQSADKQHVDELLDEALDESFPASDSPSVGGSN